MSEFHAWLQIPYRCVEVGPLMKAELKWSEKYKKVSRRNKPAASMISVFNTHTAALDSVIESRRACVLRMATPRTQTTAGKIPIESRMNAALPPYFPGPGGQLDGETHQGGVSIMVHRCRWSCWMGR